MLVTSSGANVQGYAADTTGTVETGKLTDISIPVGQETISKATTTASLTGNLAADGNVSSGSSVIDSQDLTTAGGTAPTAATVLTSVLTTATGTAAFTPGQVLTLNAQHDGSALTAKTLTVGATTTVGDLETFFNGSLGIDTTVAGAGAKLVAGGTAASAKLQVTGNDGAANALAIPSAGFADAAGNTPLTFTADPTSNPAGESTTTSMTLYNSLGDPVTVNLTAVLESKGDSGTSWKFFATSGQNADATDPDQTLVGTGTLNFKHGRAADERHRQRPEYQAGRHRCRGRHAGHARLLGHVGPGPGLGPHRVAAGDEHPGRHPDRHADQLQRGRRRDDHRQLRQRPDQDAGPSGAGHVRQQQRPEQPGRQQLRRGGQQRDAQDQHAGHPRGRHDPERGPWSRATST